MRILFIGDIVGKPGRKAVRQLLPSLRKRYEPDIVIANGENMAGGAGITADTAREMFALDIAVLTGGNHAFDQRDAIEYIGSESRIVRPLNYPPGTPGRGCTEIEAGGEPLAVVSVQGRVFMRSLDDPFRAMDTLLEGMDHHSHILVDVHAEATAEKQALGLYLDGRVSAVVGTHTHVPTADARVLPGGTAYITDVGMTGPRDSVIGMKAEPVIERFKTQMFHRYEVAAGPVLLCAVVVEIDHKGKATNIELIQQTV